MSGRRESSESRRIHEIPRLFVGDYSKTRVNQRRRDQLSVNHRRLRNKYAHACRA